METEPLVNSNTQMNNYNSEDASSILNQHQGTGMDSDGGGPAIQRHIPLDKPEPDKSNHNVLERFHEDALQQIGHGRMQLTVMLVCGLVVAADLAEIMALILSVKMSQFDFCVDDTQKSWLVGATLLGMGMGAAVWPHFGDHVGRRRVLTYCLGGSVIFSGASVIMPTEGTFLTARLFSGIGLGGCLPLAVTYLSEFIQERRRRLAITILFLFWPLGAAYVIMLSWFILPSTGFHLNEGLKQHFSAWRRLLLASSAPSFLGVILLIFMPEGPLNLMQNGKDAESLSVYKRIHKWNRGTGSNFCFSEIEIPSVLNGTPTNPPSSVIGDLSKALESLWFSFLTLWTGNRRRLTITLTLIFFMAAMGQGAVTSWVISLQAALRDWTFDKGATFNDSLTIHNTNITQDFINIRYRDCTFMNLSIENVVMNHVKFENCIFQDVNFTNVKASYVLFLHSNLTDCFLVDTDLGRSNFQDSVLENISYSGSDPTCHLIPDFNMELANDMLDSGLPVLGIFIGALLSAILINFCSRSRLTSGYLMLAALTSIGLTIWKLDPTFSLVGHTFINVLVAGMWSILITTFDRYPSWTRAGALGLIVAAGRIGSFFGVGLFGTTLQGILVPIFSSIFLVLSACVAFRSHF